MFDMARIGKNIARLRKRNGLTQMGLADALGISFQAVSNWERGNTMPDISKLPDLAAILGVTVDELLGNEQDAVVIEKAMGRSPEPLTVAEFAAVAPLMEPEQARERFNDTQHAEESRGREIGIGELAALAPFLDDDVLGELAMAAAEGGCELSKLAAVAPFLDDDVLAKLAEKAAEGGSDPGELAALAPFLDDDVLGRIARGAVKSGRWCIADLAAIAPFMDGDDLGEIVKSAAMAGGDMSGLAALAPFLDSDFLSDYVRTLLNVGGDLSILAALSPFLKDKGGRKKHWR